MLREYEEVLQRAKFGFDPVEVDGYLSRFLSDCRPLHPDPLDLLLLDPKDLCFYEAYATMRRQQEHTYLITGNLHHFPEDDHILSPRQAMDLFDSLKRR